jgi:hypothetical protein
LRRNASKRCKCSAKREQHFRFFCHFIPTFRFPNASTLGGLELFVYTAVNSD